MTYYLAALRDGPGLVYMSSSGRWFPLSLFNVKGTMLRLRQYRYVGSAIEVASIYAKRAGCGWRVEMVTG
jgi:hypothetical protein